MAKAQKMRKQIKKFYKDYDREMWKEIKPILDSMIDGDTFHIDYYVSCSRRVLIDVEDNLSKMLRFRESGNDIEVDVLELDELRSRLVAIIGKIDDLNQL